jgi:acetyl esterase
MSAVLDEATAALLAQMQAGGGKPLAEQTVEEVRAGMEAGTAALRGPLTDVGRIDERTIPVAGGSIAIRIYTPPTAVPGRALPVIVGFHGGGFVGGSLDTYEGTARYLCRHAEAIVVAVGYRRPPEHKFPTAVEDAYAAVSWAAENAASFGGDPSRIAVTGDSAGGNLAAVVCLLARDRGTPRIAFQALFYPVTDHTLAPSPSRAQFGNGQFFLSNADMEWFRGHYLAGPADAADPRVSPLLAPDHSGLPPALIVTAGCDPLLDDGKAYADRLSAAGVPVEYRCYEGTIHAFTAFAGVLPAGAAARSFAAGRIRAALQG